MSLKRRFLKARFSLTNDCPYNCYFCHNEGMGKQENANEERLSVKDYIYLAKILKKEFDLKCITLTGGDPFLYPNLDKLVVGLKKIDIEVLALTRGLPVHQWLIKSPDIFKYLDYVYFSIETLSCEEFQKNCRVNKQYLELGISALRKLTSKGVKTKIKLCRR